MEKFVLSCESTVDMPYSLLAARNIPVLFYTYTIDDTEYVDDMLRNANALPEFYGMLSAGKLPSTSQLNQFRYEEFFEQLIEQGDILHITFGTGMTNSFRNALEAAKFVEGRHPDRKITVIDSMCSSSGYGMLIDYAADLRDEGKTADEIAAWLLANRQRIHHQFYATRMDFFRRSGRVSGPVSAVAAILGICPIMRLDDEGKIIAYDKVRGKRNAIRATLDAMTRHAQNGLQYRGKCIISHSDCPEEAAKLRDAVAERFPALNEGNIRIFDIGTIIASHCGPGTVAIFFLGDERKPLA